MAIGLPLYLLIDVLFPIRGMVIQNARLLTSYAMIDDDRIPEVPFVFKPLIGIQGFLSPNFGGDLFVPDNMLYIVFVEYSIMFVALVITFVAVPVTIFTYYIYEPRWSRKLRPWLWSSFCQWVSSWWKRMRRSSDGNGFIFFSITIHLFHIIYVSNFLKVVKMWMPIQSQWVMCL